VAWVVAWMVVAWMAPIAPNADDGEARWQTTGQAAICAALGSMAGLIVHPDIKGAARRTRRRARSIPCHWCEYMCAWAEMRTHYKLVEPVSYEEVMSMTLFDNIEFRLHGQHLPAERWAVVADAGITRITHIWSEQHGRPRTAAEMCILPGRADKLVRSIPRKWIHLLETGRTALKAGEWALHDGLCRDLKSYTVRTSSLSKSQKRSDKKLDLSGRRVCGAVLRQLYLCAIILLCKCTPALGWSMHSGAWLITA